MGGSHGTFELRLVPDKRTLVLQNSGCGHAVDTCIAEVWILPTMNSPSSGGIVGFGASNWSSGCTHARGTALRSSSFGRSQNDISCREPTEFWNGQHRMLTTYWSCRGLCCGLNTQRALFELTGPSEGSVRLDTQRICSSSVAWQRAQWASATPPVGNVPSMASQRACCSLATRGRR